MAFDEQIRYLQRLYALLERKSMVFVVEDAYAERQPPIVGAHHWDAFKQFDDGDRKKILSVNDWIANRILEQRPRVPIPFTYRTLEEWASLGEQAGFTPKKSLFIGFPEKRDTRSPQSLLVLEK